MESAWLPNSAKCFVFFIRFLFLFLLEDEYLTPFCIWAHEQLTERTHKLHKCNKQKESHFIIKLVACIRSTSLYRCALFGF